MIAYPDTSFLCAIYRRRDNSSEAAAYFKTLPEVLHVSSLLLIEFCQSLRFQIWRHPQNPTEGFPQAEGAQALADLQSDLDTGVTAIIPRTGRKRIILPKGFRPITKAIAGRAHLTCWISPRHCIWTRGIF